MIIHISEERFERIRSQGYHLGTYPDPSPERIKQQSDYEYHLLKSESERCSTCGVEAESIPVNDVVELETVKAMFRVYDNGYGPPKFSASEIQSMLDKAAAHV